MGRAAFVRCSSWDVSPGVWEARGAVQTYESCSFPGLLSPRVRRGSRPAPVPTETPECRRYPLQPWDGRTSGKGVSGPSLGLATRGRTGVAWAPWDTGRRGKERTTRGLRGPCPPFTLGRSLRPFPRPFLPRPPTSSRLRTYSRPGVHGGWVVAGEGPYTHIEEDCRREGESTVYQNLFYGKGTRSQRAVLRP